MASIALADDHILLRNGLANLVKSLGHTVVFEADHGQHFIDQMAPDHLPEVVLMDINMPVKDGFDTTQWLKQQHPTVKVLALSMYDNEASIIRMLKCGAKGYILKDSDPAELEYAIRQLLSKGYYYSDLVSGKLIHAINTMEDSGSGANQVIQLNDKEINFLKLACTELTYKEIADQLYVSPRTVDGYRDVLFEKLQVKTRVGLVLFAIKNKLVNIE